jgi:hypothetical protein
MVASGTDGDTKTSRTNAISAIRSFELVAVKLAGPNGLSQCGAHASVLGYRDVLLVLVAALDVCGDGEYEEFAVSCRQFQGGELGLC